MATGLDVVERVRTLLGGTDHLGEDEILALAQNRYEEFYETWLWSRRQRDFVISLVAPVESDETTTLTVNNGSAAISALGTPFTSAMDGRLIRIEDSEEYYTFGFLTTSTGTLQDGSGGDAPWIGENNADATWIISKVQYALPSDAAQIISLATDQYQIREMDGGRSRLDLLDPGRITTDSRPTHWVYASVNSDNVKMIEVWPVPTTVRLLRGQYLRDAPILDLTTTIDVPVPILVYATAADCFAARAAKTGDVGDGQMGIFYERKYGEVLLDYKPLERERTSPPRSIGRLVSPRLGGDYYLDHHIETDWP